MNKSITDSPYFEGIKELVEDLAHPFRMPDEDPRVFRDKVLGIVQECLKPVKCTCECGRVLTLKFNDNILNDDC